MLLPGPKIELRKRWSDLPTLQQTKKLTKLFPWEQHPLTCQNTLCVFILSWFSVSMCVKTHQSCPHRELCRLPALFPGFLRHHTWSNLYVLPHFPGAAEAKVCQKQNPWYTAVTLFLKTNHKTLIFQSNQMVAQIWGAPCGRRQLKRHWHGHPWPQWPGRKVGK